MKGNWHLCYRATRVRAWILSSLALVALLPQLCAQENFSVTGGSGVNYFINGQNDPPLTLQRGVTYVFLLSNVSIHPFWIKSSLGSGSSGRYDTGVSGNGATSGSVTFAVPQNAPDTLFYQCGVHPSMNGTLTIVTPIAPPDVKIVFIGVGDFVTVKSTGTNGWSAVPEYRCSEIGATWQPVVPFTNSYSAGTNTTTFGRLDPICGSSAVLLRIQNQED